MQICLSQEHVEPSEEKSEKIIDAKEIAAMNYFNKRMFTFGSEKTRPTKKFQDYIYISITTSEPVKLYMSAVSSQSRKELLHQILKDMQAKKQSQGKQNNLRSYYNIMDEFDKRIIIQEIDREFKDFYHKNKIKVDLKSANYMAEAYKKMVNKDMLGLLDVDKLSANAPASEIGIKDEKKLGISKKDLNNLYN